MLRSELHTATGNWHSGNALLKVCMRLLRCGVGVVLLYVQCSSSWAPAQHSHHSLVGFIMELLCTKPSFLPLAACRCLKAWLHKS
jgi:hypothetical protein